MIYHRPTSGLVATSPPVRKGSKSHLRVDEFWEGDQNQNVLISMLVSGLEGDSAALSVVALQHFFAVTLTHDLGKFADMLPRSRAGIIVGSESASRWKEEQGSGQPKAPLIFVKTSPNWDGRSENAGEDIPRYGVRANEAEILLPNVVARAVVEELLHQARRAVLSSSVFLSLPKLRKAGWAVFSPDGAAIRSVQALARKVECSPRKLEKDWRSVRGCARPQLTLKDLLTAGLFWRAVLMFLGEPESDWSTVAETVGVSPPTLSRYFRRWSADTPAEFTLSALPAAIMRFETQVLQILANPVNGLGHSSEETRERSPA